MDLNSNLAKNVVVVVVVAVRQDEIAKSLCVRHTAGAAAEKDISEGKLEHFNNLFKICQSRTVRK